MLMSKYHQCDTSHISPEARSDLINVFQRYEDVLPAIVKMEGEIGKIALLCIAAGEEDRINKRDVPAPGKGQGTTPDTKTMFKNGFKSDKGFGVPNTSEVPV